MPATQNQPAPQPAQNQASGSETDWQRAYGDPDLNTEYSVKGTPHTHDIAEKSFADHHSDQPIDATIQSEEQQRWRLLAAKVFAEGTLRDANVVEADVSDFKVKVGEPNDPKWHGLEKYIYDREEVVVGRIPFAPGIDQTYKTIDLGILLLKGDDTQIKTIMQGTFYNSSTVFHADREYDKLIHDRLESISTAATKEAADAAKYDYQGLRQESCPIATDHKVARAADGKLVDPTPDAPFSHLASNLTGELMGDQKTAIPPLSGEVTERIAALATTERTPESRQRADVYQAVNALIARARDVENLANTFTATTQDDQKENILQKFKALVGDPQASFQTRNQYVVEMKIDAEKAYPCIKTSEMDAYLEQEAPGDPEADPALKIKRAELLKARMHDGIPVSDTWASAKGLVITGMVFDHTPSYLGQNGIEQLESADYLMAKDASERRYLVPVDSDAIEVVDISKGAKAGSVPGCDDEVKKLKDWLERNVVESGQGDLPFMIEHLS